MNNLTKILAILALSVVISGCWGKKTTPTPIQEAVAEYIKSGDIKKTQSILNSSALPASSENAAMLMKANLQIAQSFKDAAELSEMKMESLKKTQNMLNSAVKINSLTIQKQCLENIVQTNIQKAELLKTGNEQFAGINQIRAELEEKQNLLSKLNEQISDLELQAQSAKSQAEAVAAQSDALLAQAEIQTNLDNKAQLKHQAYTVLLGGDTQNSKHQLMNKYQQAIDEITVIQSQIKVLEPQIAYLDKQVQTAEKKISIYQDEQNNAQLQKSLNDLEGQLQMLSDNLLSQTRAIEQVVDSYTQKQKEIAQSLESSNSSIRRFSSDDELTDISKIITANSSYTIARLSAESCSYLKDISNILGSVSSVSKEDISEKILKLSSQYLSLSGQYYQKAIEDYDKAIESCGGLIRAAGRNGKCDAMQYQLKIMQEKASLFDNNEGQIPSELIDAIKALTEELGQCNPDNKN